MNAYELADELQDLHGLYCEDAANMLRQQADRISELEKETHSINYTCPNCETHVELFYKTPQIKELSDEEIYKLAEYHGLNDWLYETSVPDFAKAILKKASEK
jgi:hypothetical protein